LDYQPQGFEIDLDFLLFSLLNPEGLEGKGNILSTSPQDPSNKPMLGIQEMLSEFM
jgi:hypothetical protein